MHGPSGNIKPPLWRRIWQGLHNIASDRVRLLSLLEQGLQSGANFLALLILARGFSNDNFGTFSFAYLTLLFVMNIQRSMLIFPFVIHAAEHAVMVREAGLWKRLSFWTTALNGLLLLAVALALPQFGAPDWMQLAFMAAAIFVIPCFEYEFRRRFLIQQDLFGHSVTAALIYLIIYIGGVAWAVYAQELLYAFGAYAAANAVAALYCAIVSPKLPQPENPPKFRQFLTDLRHFIGWSVASNLAYNGYAHIPPLILGAMTGPGPVALFQAMRNFTQPLSVAATAVDNFDKPRAARAYAADGVKGLKRALGHTTMAMTIMTLPYLVLLLTASDWLVSLVYEDRYTQTLPVLAWFALVHVAILFVYPLETGLFLLRRPDLLFIGRILSAVTGVGLCFALIPHWGLNGAMAGILGGTIVSGLAAYVLMKREKPWLPKT